MVCEHMDGPHFVSAVFLTEEVAEFIEEINDTLGEEGLRCIMFLSGGLRGVTVCVSHATALTKVPREFERVDHAGRKPTMVDIIDATSLKLCARITNG